MRCSRDMPPPSRRQLANFYAQRAEDVRRGGKTRPRQRAHVRRNDALLRACKFFPRNCAARCRKTPARSSDADIEDYYKKNEASYEQANLARIYIPRAKQIAPAAAKPGKAGAKARRENQCAAASDRGAKESG